MRSISPSLLTAADHSKVEGCRGSRGHGTVSLLPVVAGSPPPSCLNHTPTIGGEGEGRRKRGGEEKKREGKEMERG